MCGFVGQFASSRSVQLHKSLDNSLELLKHRGPDSAGKFASNISGGYIEIGFRRLSIIDLSEDANQPFISTDNRFVLVFNGEIYNYVELKNELISKGYTFRTDSDTEVLISAWQEWQADALNKFIGMFSMVILDQLKFELWCIRDAYGIKPFFYTHTKDNFAFASEINALNKLNNTPPAMNKDVAIKYIVDGEYDRSVETFFSGVSQLEPGHMMKIDLASNSLTLSKKRWWFPKIAVDTEISFKQAAEQLRHEFLESIAIHLRSDVKVATALSGGLDSSAIVSAMRKIEPDIDIHTFSYVADDPRINENEWVELVNNSTTSISHKIEVSPNDFYQDLDDLVLSQGEPFGSTSLYAQYRIYKAAKAAGITVMLDGQGADELLAGYYGYPENRVQSLLDKHEFAQAVSLITRWAKWPGRDKETLIKSSLKYLLPLPIRGIAGNLVKRNKFPNFVKRDFHDLELFPDVYSKNIWHGKRLIQRLLKEQSNGALVSLLRHADRNSMRWSIESRVPFLNTRLSSLVLSLPEHFLLSQNGETKSVFREAMKGIVDQRILDRKDKIGFATPQNKWVTTNLMTEDSIIQGIDSVDFFNANLTRKYLISEGHNSTEDLNRKWRIFNLIKWHQILGIAR